jgi:hypothetical protein
MSFSYTRYDSCPLENNCLNVKKALLPSGQVSDSLDSLDVMFLLPSVESTHGTRALVSGSQYLLSSTMNPGGQNLKRF